MKILIAAPTSRIKHYAFGKYIEGISCLDFDRTKFDILLCDNTNDSGMYYKSLRLRFNAVRSVPVETIQETIRKSQNVLRAFFLQSDYTHFLSLESDVVPPPNALKLMLQADKDVVSIPYFVGQNESLRLLGSYLNENNELTDYTPGEMFNLMSGELVPITNNGIGCTLIKRHVLEKIEFRIDENSDVFSDTYFHVDLIENNFENYMITSIFATHYSTDWSVQKNIFKNV